MIVHLFEELSAPLSADQVCGPDLGYDTAFTALETAALGTPERHSGDVLVPAEPPNWSEVYDVALALARRTRDLRLAVLLTRAGARTQGLVGYVTGLTLIARLLERYWESMYPLLEDGDAERRMNVLAELCSRTTGLQDLRATYLVAPGHPLTVRLIELAFTPAEPLPGEVRPTPAGIGKGVQDAAVADAALPERLKSIHAAASDIERILAERVGLAGPSLGPLLNITRALDLAAAAAKGGTVAVVAAGVVGSPVDEQVASTPDVIRTREDVVRTLGGVCDWIERHEPSNPAPLLIRRAQRLMSKSFIDLVRDLAPDGLTQLEHIAGVAKP
jgi:type VI secretion system protein ImpA